MARVAYENRKLFLITTGGNFRVSPTTDSPSLRGEEEDPLFGEISPYVVCKCLVAAFLPVSHCTLSSRSGNEFRPLFSRGSLSFYNANNIRKLINIHLHYKRKLMVTVATVGTKESLLNANHQAWSINSSLMLIYAEGMSEAQPTLLLNNKFIDINYQHDSIKYSFRRE